MAEELRFNIVSTADSKGFDKAAKDLKETKAEADKLGKSFESLGDNAESLEQSTADATKSVKSHGEQVRVLRAEYEKTTKQIAELDAQLLGGGDSKAIQKDLRERRAWLAEIQRVAKEVQRTTGTKFSLTGDDSSPITGVLEGLLGNIPKVGGLDPRLLAGGAAIGVALAPGLSAAIAGAVIGTAGAGGIVGGALLAARDPQVQAAFGGLKDTFLDTLRPAGDAFVQPVLNSIDILEKELQKGKIAAALAAIAPQTEKFTKGIAGFVNEAADGIKSAFDKSGPLFDMWQKELPETGRAVGYFFNAISSDAPGAAKALGQVFDVIQAGTKVTGDAIGGLTVLNHLLQFPGVGGGLDKIPLDGTLGAINRFANGPEIQKASEAMTGFTVVTKENRDALMADAVAAQTAARRTQDLAIAQLDATVKARDLKAAWDELHGTQLTLDEAYKRAYDGLERVKQAFEGANDSVKGNSEAAVGRRLALEQEAAIAVQLAQSYLTMTGDAAGAQKILDDFKASAEKATGATGAAKKEVDALADSLFKLPPKREVFVTIYKRTIEGDFRAGERGQNLLDPGTDTRASGGPVTAGRPYLVGEKGPELVVPTQNAYVYPNRGGSGGMGGSGVMWAAPLVLNFPSGSYEAALVESISTAVQARGGQLSVLGLRAP